MKGMRKRFQNKSGRPRQRPNGKLVRLAGGLAGAVNDMWRFK